MSDCFDHELDAWESYEQAEELTYGYVRSTNREFTTDHLYYHKKIHFNALIHETKRAYLFHLETEDGEPQNQWIPKGVCKEYCPASNTVWVLEAFCEGANL